MQVSFQVPEWVVAGGNYVTDNLLIIAVLVGAAILASIVTELYKRHYFKKKDVKLAKSWIATWVTLSSTFFTYLGYVLFIASANMSFLQTLPVVGEHALKVVGIGYVIYNVRLNKWYQGVSQYLHKWSKSNDDKAPVSPIGNVAVVAPPVDEREFTLPE